MSLGRHNQSGFTIVELMIATVVLSIILLISGTVLISIGGLYTKGTTGSDLQNNARNITETLSTAAEYSGAANPIANSSHPYGTVTVKSVCAAGTMISYVPDTIPTGNLSTIWQSPDPGNCMPIDLTSAQTTTASSQNIGLPHEAIHTLTAINTGTLLIPFYTIKIDAYIVTGNDQLVGYDPLHPLAPLPGPTVRCNGQTGDQFCYTANLSNSVGRRLP